MQILHVNRCDRVIEMPSFAIFTRIIGNEMGRPFRKQEHHIVPDVHGQSLVRPLRQPPVEPAEKPAIH